jgi:hypothetical protein
VDLCVKESNLNIAMRHTLWMYATIQPEYTPMQPESVKKNLGSSSPSLYRYESNHASTCAKVEHGRNHFITGH